MVMDMLKKNSFILVILIIYLLFLCKDPILGRINNQEDLNQVIADLKIEYYKKEYEDMAKIIDVDTKDYDVIYSRVLFRDIYQFYDEFTISKGSIDGVEKKDLVLSDLGVVGIISRVNKNTSTVLMLTSPEIELSVKIGDAYGILTSEDKKIIVKNIALDKKMKVNDKVYTSGLTNIPGDILIGEVKEVSTDSLELEYLLDVESLAYLDKIKYIAIIKGEEI